MVQGGNFTGQIFRPGLEADKNASGDGIEYIAPFHSLENKVPDDINSNSERLEQDLLKGKIVVPERYPVEISNLTTIS
jgi:basic membrane protein A